MTNKTNKTLEWIRQDFKSYPFRFCMEFVAWSISMGCSLTMAMTVPNPPLIFIYPFWIVGCGIYSWSAYTRKSFGMLMNYFLLMSIDFLAFYRLVVYTH